MTAQERIAKSTADFSALVGGLIDDAIKSHVLKEREECAKIADENTNLTMDGRDAAEYIAEKIRARQ